MSRTYRNGHLVQSIDQLQEGDVLETRLHDGTVQSIVVTFQEKPPQA